MKHEPPCKGQEGRTFQRERTACAKAPRQKRAGVQEALGALDAECPRPGLRGVRKGARLPQGSPPDLPSPPGSQPVLSTPTASQNRPLVNLFQFYSCLQRPGWWGTLWPEARRTVCEDEMRSDSRLCLLGIFICPLHSTSWHILGAR